MSMIRWIRKNNKKLLAVIGTVVMVIFLLPSAFFRMQNRRQTDQTIGFYLTPQGQKQKITSTMLGQANREVRALTMLGLDKLAQQQIMYDFDARFCQLAFYQLIFADSYFGNIFRNYLYQHLEQSDLLEDPEQLEKVIEQVDRISGLERPRGSLFYFLLTEEAHHAGFFASETLVNNIFQTRAQMKSQGLPLAPITAVSRECGLTEQQLRQNVANYLAIIQYANSTTSAWSVSEPQLKKIVLDEVETDNVEGDYVTFAHYMFTNQVIQPTQEQLQNHFDAYKNNDPQKFSDDNPCGFGYRLPDRVQIEYCRIGIEDADILVEKQFQQLSPDQQEQTLQNFWMENKELFRKQLPPEKGQENAEPKYRDPDYDEIVNDVRTQWQRRQALDKAEQLMARILSQTPKSDVNNESPDNGTLTASADYQQIQKQFTSDELPVTWKKSDFLSFDQVRNDPELANTYLVRNNQKQQILIDMLFNCEPLRKRPPTHLDQTPVKLMEDLGPLLSYRTLDQVQAVYLIRIIDVDAARVPVSMEDDGAAKEPSTNVDNTVQKDTPAEQENSPAMIVQQNWKKYQAYLLAVNKAETFARNDPQNWDTAIEQVNKELADDPNKPAGAGPVFQDNVSKTRDRIAQLENMAREQGSMDIYRMIDRHKIFLQSAVQLSRQTHSSDTLPVLKQPKSLRCIVFKNLQATPPSQQDYLRRKAMTVLLLQAKNQQLAALNHFDPDNILKRNHYERVEQDEHPQADYPFPPQRIPLDEEF